MSRNSINAHQQEATQQMGMEMSSNGKAPASPQEIPSVITLERSAQPATTQRS